MRVLFLDFDGCTHPAGILGHQTHYSVPEGLFQWMPILINLLQPLQDVLLVVHSPWRHTHHVDAIGDVLGDLGSRYLGVTPPPLAQWESITRWLSQNSASTWRILSVAPSEFPDPPPSELIVCHPATGLSAEYVQNQLKDWLETS